MLTLLLLRHIAHQALDRHRLPCPAPLMQAYFELLQLAIGCFIANRGAVDRLAVQHAAQQRGRFGPAVWAESLFEELVRLSPGM